MRSCALEATGSACLEPPVPTAATTDSSENTLAIASTPLRAWRGILRPAAHVAPKWDRVTDTSGSQPRSRRAVLACHSLQAAETEHEVACADGAREQLSAREPRLLTGRSQQPSDWMVRFHRRSVGWIWL